MKYEIRVPSIERRCPASFRLPAGFHSFVTHCRNSQRGDYGWFSVKYTKPDELLGFDPKKKLLPVLRLADGGFVAFWFLNGRTIPVCAVDSEGNARLIAASWADFLRRLQRHRTGLPDLDDQESVDFPKIRGVKKTMQPLRKLRNDFQRWVDENSNAEVPSDVDEGERLRARLHELLDHHFPDRDDWDMLHLVVHVTSRSYRVELPMKRPFPDAEKIRPVLEELVEYLGHSLKNCELDLWSDGSVFVGRNITLGNVR